MFPFKTSPCVPATRPHVHSGPTALAHAFCCSSTSSLGGSSGRSRDLLIGVACLRSASVRCCLVLSCPVLSCPGKFIALALAAVAAKVVRFHVTVVLFVFVLFISRLLAQLINFRVPVDFLTESGSYVHFCPRPRSDGPGSQPTDIRNHTKCAARALVPTLAVYPWHVCHRQRHWAVSTGSHMHQDMGISMAPPH